MARCWRRAQVPGTLSGSTASMSQARARIPAARSPARLAIWLRARFSKTWRSCDDARMAKVFVTRRIPGDALERLSAEHRVEIWQGRLQPSHAKLLEKACDVDGLLCLLTDRIGRDVIAGCQNLRVISNYAVGVDNVDIEA